MMTVPYQLVRRTVNNVPNELAFPIQDFSIECRS